MISRTLKLRLNQAEEQELSTWLWHLTGVYNWALRKIELDGQDGIHLSTFDLNNLLVGHSQRMSIPSDVLRGTASAAHAAWRRCYSNQSRKPKLKSDRNRLNYISLPSPIAIANNKAKIKGFGSVRFHPQQVPYGQVKCGRIVRRSTGWYLVLTINAEPTPVPLTGQGCIGIDPGFETLITLSNGEKVAHPRELEFNAIRLAQAQRGRNRGLIARLSTKGANQRKDRNHKLSRRLVAENQVIAFSKDNIKGLSRAFGKSVASSSHSQLRSMLAYKCRAGGRQYIEVPSRNSTKTCSACGSLSGPTGYAGLKVRHWQCDACGADHDRDINAAINTLIVGLGLSHERYREIASENLVSVGGSKVVNECQSSEREQHDANVR